MRIFIMKKDTLIKIAAFAVIIVGAVFYARTVVNAEQPAFADSEDGVLCMLPAGGRDVSLTIDTTFGDDVTDEILEVLRRHGAKATFAVMGAWAKENPEKVRAIIADGHEIISHSMTHERYNDMGPQGALADAKAAKEYLKTAFGTETSYIRLPYGVGNDEIIAALREGGFTPVKWSIDSKDWMGESADAISKRVLDNIEKGSIILFQNNNETTPEALDIILEKMGDNAYAAVRLSDITAHEQGESA